MSAAALVGDRTNEARREPVASGTLIDVRDWWSATDEQPLQLGFTEPAGYALEFGGREVVRFPGSSPAAVELADDTLDVAAFGSGWRFAFVSRRSGSPRAWYDGHSLLRAARVVVAPDREYELRTRLTAPRRWELREAGTIIATVTVASGAWNGDLRVTPGAPPAVRADRPLLVAIACFAVIHQMLTPDLGRPDNGGG